MLVLLHQEKEKCVVIPKGKGSTVADLIVLLLSQEWPLSVRGLHRRIAHSHARDVSFQAVHKAIRRLSTERIIEKTERYYRLSPQWMREAQQFLIQTSREYETREAKLNGVP